MFNAALKPWLLCLTLAVLTGYAHAAQADAFEQGVAAYQRGEFDTTLTKLRPLAESGNARAQFTLGKMYAEGQGVTADQTEATRWYRKAAEQGNADAQHNLAVRYQNGKGVETNPAAAVQWYRKAAAQGHVTAQNNLGLMYVLGNGVAQDYTVGARLIAKAARAGSEPARKNIPRLTEDMANYSIEQTDTPVREQPSAQAEVLLAVKEGVEAKVLGTRGDWTEILIPTNYLTGWVTSSPTATAATASTDSIIEPETVTVPPKPAQTASVQRAGVADTTERMRVAGDNVNVRAAPSTASNVVRQADENEPVEVLERRGDWIKVRFVDNQSQGWIASFLLRSPPQAR